ncbi:Uncharacterised protein [Mycobacteroides abscessus subsp. abscessus]|nr:Uncharacterised protein [Mycobacteroides abscessus subsp. abscessus]
MRLLPAFEPAVSTPIRRRPAVYAGCASSRRRISPPAYPLAPATATENPVVMELILYHYAQERKYIRGAFAHRSTST